MSRRYYEEDEEDDKGVRKPRRAPDYQFELGTAGILSMFAAVAILCGLFYAFGFTVGKHAVPATFSLGDTANATPAAAAQPANKPEAGTPIQNPAAAPNGAPPNPSDLTAAEVNQTPQTLVPASGNQAASAPGATGNSVAANGSPQPQQQAQAVPQPPVPQNSTAPQQPPQALPLANPNSAQGQAANLNQTWAVQVFAGAREEDALSLAAALKSRQYPVFILKPANSGDGLYHVQIGPYKDRNQAEQMRARLAADGYNAIIE